METLEQYTEIITMQVREALNLLGSNIASMSQMLKNKGIKGYCEDAAKCVLAQYLAEQFPSFLVEVHGDITMWPQTGPFIEEEIEIPAGELIEAFIDAFDNGYYPSLIQHGEGCKGWEHKKGLVQCGCDYLFTEDNFGKGE